MLLKSMTRGRFEAHKMSPLGGAEGTPPPETVRKCCFFVYEGENLLLNLNVMLNTFDYFN